MHGLPVCMRDRFLLVYGAGEARYPFRFQLMQRRTPSFSAKSIWSFVVSKRVQSPAAPRSFQVYLCEGKVGECLLSIFSCRDLRGLSLRVAFRFPEGSFPSIQARHVSLGGTCRASSRRPCRSSLEALSSSQSSLLAPFPVYKPTYTA